MKPGNSYDNIRDHMWTSYICNIKAEEYMLKNIKDFSLEEFLDIEETIAEKLFLSKEASYKLITGNLENQEGFENESS